MSIVTTGGGTGGHLTIIKAVKEHIKDKELIYIGSTKGQDRDWFEGDRSFKECYFLDSYMVMDKGILGKIIALLNIAKQTLVAKKILKEQNAKVVFSVGGYSAAPAAFAAVMLRVPLVIHEQNAYVGNLNKILRPFAKAFISSYEDDSLEKSYPINDIFFKTARVRKEIKNILIVGGSQGSVTLNNFALKIAPRLNQKGIKIYHQAGVKNVESVKAEYKKLNIDAEVFGFTKDLPQIIANSDFAISRAGASTLWELTANGLPALYVPYPYAANDHQYYNAKFLVDKNLAWVKRDNELDEEFLFNIISQDLSHISQELIKQIEPGGAQRVAKYLESL
jgi:UDP-N-acetylglucosamine--N-acetylmuramyl-(pentapeptide) pyrophosphoryl-undecaprenol N-acetylglucosamine transferase